GGGRGARWFWELPDDEALLRPALERERAEQLRRIRREVAGWSPGHPWTPPAHHEDLYRYALRERGPVVVRIGDQDRLLREEDMGRVPLLDQLARALAEGDVAAEAPLRDCLAEMEIDADSFA